MILKNFNFIMIKYLRIKNVLVSIYADIYAKLYLSTSIQCVLRVKGSFIQVYVSVYIRICKYLWACLCINMIMHIFVSMFVCMYVCALKKQNCKCIVTIEGNMFACTFYSKFTEILFFMEKQQLSKFCRVLFYSWIYSISFRFYSKFAIFSKYFAVYFTS